MSNEIVRRLALSRYFSASVPLQSTLLNKCNEEVNDLTIIKQNEILVKKCQQYSLKRKNARRLKFYFRLTSLKKWFK